MNLNENYIKLIDEKLRGYTSGITQPLLREAMEYSLFAGGKRIRPLLLIAAADGKIEEALPFACALECIHTYSLIHDDLPALDNDDLRRGVLTSHKKFGEATAILAGDGLLNLAAEIMSGHCSDFLERRNVSAMKEIMLAAGVNGMISGQMDDIFNDFEQNEEAIISMYERKTGRLIIAAVVSGAILSARENVEEIRLAAKKLGEAFQIKDDILDVTSDAAVLGKNVKSDEKNGKNTYVAAFGLEAANERFLKLSEEAVDGFSRIYGEDAYLTKISKNMTNRRV